MLFQCAKQLVKFITASVCRFIMHHAIANADTNYHIDPNHDNATSVLEMPSRGRAATLAAPMLNRGWFQLFAQSTTKYSARAIDLVQRSTIVDMLNPFTLIGVLAPLKGDKRPTWFTNPETFTAGDFQRFKDSRIDVMNVAVGTVGPNAYDQVTSFIGYWNGFIAHRSEERR